MSFKIADLVDKTDAFDFEYDGFHLTGRYYKYKTRTPNYGKEKRESLPAELTKGTEEELAANAKARDDAAEKIGWQWFTDTIIEWNAIDDNGPLPITEETFDKLPVAFTRAFQDFFDELISPKKKQETNSASG